jgi:hypothetical protein
MSKYCKGVIALLVSCSLLGQSPVIKKQSVVVKKEKTPSLAALNQDASQLVGEMLKTSAELVKELGELQVSCLSSLERVLDAEGSVTKTKLSTVELKKCVDSLRVHDALLKKIKEEISCSCAFCSATL